MKKTVTIFILLVLIFVAPVISLADSPITSTFFSEAYDNLPVFNDGSEQMFEYLSNDANPIDLRLAVINAASWDIDGKNRADNFVSFLCNKFKVNDAELLEKLSGQQTICLAYIKAMDDYFDVDLASTLANIAVEKSPDSYAVNLIAAIINAQDKEGRDVFLETDRVRQRQSELTHDFPDEASALVFEYMDIYEDAETPDPLEGFIVYEQYAFRQMFNFTPTEEYEDWDVPNGRISVCQIPEQEQIYLIIEGFDPPFCMPIIDNTEHEQTKSLIGSLPVSEGEDIRVLFTYSFNDESGNVVPANFFIIFMEDPDADSHRGYGFGKIARLK